MGFVKLYPDARLPTRATTNAAAYDLRAYLEHDLYIEPGETVLVKTGVGVEMRPDQCGIIMGRSGLAKKYGISIAQGSGGLIDADYTPPNEIGALLHNSGRLPFLVINGDRIAQFLLTSYQTFGDEVDTVRTGGFGSTGT